MWKWVSEGNSAEGLWEMRLVFFFFFLAEGSDGVCIWVLMDEGEGRYGKAVQRKH